MKKSVKVIAGIIGLAAALVGISFIGGGDVNPSVTGIPVQNIEDGSWGFVNSKGKHVFQNAFESQPSLAVNGVFSVNEGDGITLYRLRKEIVPMAENLTGLKAAGVVSDKVIPVVKPGCPIEYYDYKGQSLFLLAEACGKQVVEANAVFTSGRGVFRTADGLYGAIDTEGNVVVAPVYSKLGYFGNGYALAETAESTPSHPVTVLLDGQGNEVQHFDNSSIMAGYHDNRGFINTAGLIYEVRAGEQPRPVVGKVKKVIDFNEDFIVFQNDFDEWGVVDNLDGIVLPEREYDQIRMVDDNLFLCQYKNESIIVDDENSVVKYLHDAKTVAVDGRNLSADVRLDSRIAIMGFNYPSDSHDFMFINFYDSKGNKITSGLFNDVALGLTRTVSSDCPAQ